jgi:ATP-binding cassette subfamily F protein 3
LIQLSELTKSFGDRVLFDHVTWQITDGERVGLCGPNGAGKTTLLKMMAGIDEPDAGAILKPAALTVGYLPQDGLAHSGRSLIDEATSAFGDLLRIKAEMHDVEERLGDPSVPDAEHDAMLARYSDLQDIFRHRDGYSIELKTATVLQGLGFKTADFARPCETFSGGWQMRIALAKLLLGQPNLLLLDEPTNHLDLEARNWLEEYLHAYPFAVILVSHDRFFLDAVVTRIADLTLRTLTDYVGNYSDYIVQHEAKIEAMRKAKREQDEEIARVKMFIDRFRYQATKASQVQSRIKMLEKVVPIEVPPERKTIHFNFPSCAKSGRTVLELKDVHKAYAGNVIFDRLNLHIERGDRIALVGPNGVGKSTLMRMLSGEEAPDSGQRVEGHNLVMQYFAQDEATRMDPAPTVYETLASGSPNDMVPAIRNILGGFLFSGDDVYKKVRVLSGGERTRLAVARMLLRPSNTLLLDEPTNHLDTRAPTRNFSGTKSARLKPSRYRTARPSRSRHRQRRPSREAFRRALPRSRRSITPRKNGRTPRRGRNRRPRRRSRRRSTSSRRKSPTARTPSAKSSRRCPRQASTTTATPRSGSSTGIRR